MPLDYIYRDVGVSGTTGTVNRRLLNVVFSLEFLDRHEHILLVGPAGMGKNTLAQALGYYAVRFVHADEFFKAISEARVDNSLARTLRSFLTPDLLILDDLGLHRLTPPICGVSFLNFRCGSTADASSASRK